MDQTRTTELLQRWYSGEAGALDRLLQRHLAWIQHHVKKRLGGELMRKTESEDIVQDALIRFLHDGPRLRVDSEDQFRGLMVLIVENVIRDTADWFSARRRDLAREDALTDGSSLVIRDGGILSSTPSGALSVAEDRSLIRLALELLDPTDRRIVVMRRWDDRSHAEIGAELGMSAGASSVRYSRAVLRLTEIVAQLRSPGLGGVDVPRDPPPNSDPAPGE